MRPYCVGQFVAGMDVNKCPTARRVRYPVRASDGETIRACNEPSRSIDLLTEFRRLFGIVS